MISFAVIALSPSLPSPFLPFSHSILTKDNNSSKGQWKYGWMEPHTQASLSPSFSLLLSIPARSLAHSLQRMHDYRGSRLQPYPPPLPMPRLLLLLLHRETQNAKWGEAGPAKERGQSGERGREGGLDNNTCMNDYDGRQLSRSVPDEHDH